MNLFFIKYKKVIPIFQLEKNITSTDILNIIIGKLYY